MVEPMTVPSPLTGGDAGRMAVLADPEGAVFAVWQSIDHTGADVTGEPGSDTKLAGMVQMNEQWPEEIPAHWMAYFAVVDADAAARKVAELGGTVSVEPFDLPDVGRIAVVNDLEGAVFSVMAPA